jgi:hypothetical protein
LGERVGGPVLAYVTGDRPGLQTQIAAEQLALFPRHLRALGDHEEIALLLYSRGGETQAAWPIVSFIREHCTKLTILVPFYAHSCATLISLGADRIIMGRFATLSPIDPTVANVFNPPDPTNPQQRMPIAVEDLLAYFELMRRYELKAPDQMSEGFQRLSAAGVHPLALGNVQRSIDQIRQLAEKLIRLHSPDKTEDECKELIQKLTTAAYSHFHLISRREAKEVGLPIEEPDTSVEALLWEYYEQLCDGLQLLETFDPAALLRAAAAGSPPTTPGAASAPIAQPSTAAPQPPGQQPVAGAPARISVALERAYIETETTGNAFVTRGTVSQQAAVVPAGLPPGVVPQTALPLAVTLEIVSEKWERVS